MVLGPLPSPEACPPGAAPDGLPSANTESSAPGLQKPRARASIATGEGWCVLRQGTPSTHTFPQPGPVLQPATSSRQPSHRCTGSGRKWVCSGPPRAVAHSSVASCSSLPSSEAQARSVGQLAARQPTVNPLNSAAQQPGADRGGPIHVWLPTEHGAESLLLFSPTLLSWAPRSQLLALSGSSFCLGDGHSGPGGTLFLGCSRRTRVLLLSGVPRGKTPNKLQGLPPRQTVGTQSMSARP